MRSHLASESGSVVVMVLLVTLVGLLLSTALVARAVSTETSVRRDAESRRALQAAQAGLQRALWQSTALSAATASPATPCASVDGAGRYVATTTTRTIGGVPWCADQTEQLGAGQAVTWAVSGDRDPKATEIEKEIVATGVTDGVVRRVHQQVEGFDIAALFGDYAVVSLTDLSLENNAQIGTPTLAGNARSNGNITLTGGSEICGSATPGPGKVVSTSNGASVCAGYSTAPAPAPIELPDPTLPATNDNANICANSSCPTNGWVQWNPAARTLSMNNNPSIVVRGNVFVLCRLALDNSSVLTFDPIDPSKPVRIYFDTPANCGGQTQPAVFMNNPTLTTTVAGNPPIHLYVLGSQTTSTTVNITNRNITLPVQIYAPRSTVALDNNALVTGGIAARTVTMTGSVEVRAASAPTRLQLGTGVRFTRGPFTECTAGAAGGQTLSQGC